MAAGGEAQRPWQQKVDEALRPLSAATTRLVGCFRATPARAVWGRHNPVARLLKHKGVRCVLGTLYVDALQPVFRYLYGIEHGAWVREVSSCYYVSHALLFPSLSRLGGIGKHTQTSQPAASAPTVYIVPLHAKTCFKTTPITTETTTPCDKTEPAHPGTNCMPNPFSLPGHETCRTPRTCTTLPPMSPVTCPRGCLSIRNNLSVNFSPPSPLHRPTTPPPCRSRRD
jgi:hypothetical protein